MTMRQFIVLFFLSLNLFLSKADVWSKEALPIEPDVSTRIDELSTMKLDCFSCCIP